MKRRLPLFLTLLALLLFGWKLGFEPLYDWDEAWYGQVAKEILRTGDWLTLHWRGVPFFDKPPLAIWSIALSFRLFGTAEWAARLPSALASVGTVLSVYWLGRELFASQKKAFLSALVLLATLPFLKAGRMAMLDGPLTLAFTLAVLSFWKGRRQPRWGLALGFLFGVVWLIKGPVALLLFLILGAFSLWNREIGVWQNKWLWGGLGLGFLLVLPWYLAEIRLHGTTFLASHFGVHVFGRASAAMDGHRGPLWFYLGQLALAQPWFWVLPPALWLAWKRKESGDRLLLCWFFGVLGAFSLAATKLPWYVVPIYPAFALLVGNALDDLRENRRLGFCWSVLGGSLLLAVLFLNQQPFAPALLVLALSLGIGGTLFLMKSPLGPWALAGGTLLAMLLIPSLHWEARFTPDLRPFAGQQLPPFVLSLSETVRPAFIYYLDRPEELVSPEELPMGWKRDGAALLTMEEWKKYASVLPGACPVASASGMVLLKRPSKL